MKLQFNQDITTTIPTCALVEYYQELSRAIQDGDWDLAQVVADSLSDAITDYATVPKNLDIRPSGSSLVNMEWETGIILDVDGKDLRCAAGMEVSDALRGGSDDFQCDRSCPYAEDCNPECGRIRLGKGKGEIFDVTDSARSTVMLSRLGEKKTYCCEQ